MKSSLRLPALVAALTLGAAATLVAAPAQAADPAVHYQAVALTTFDADSDCTLSSTGTQSTDEKSITTGGTQKISVTHASTATATNDMDPTDTATYAGKATLTGSVVAKGGAFTSLAIKGTMSASSKAVQGLSSDCEPAASSGQGIQMQFTVAKAGWLKLTVANTRGVQNIVILTGMTGGGIQVVTLGSKASQVIKRKVTPGAYQIQTQTQIADLNLLPGPAYAVSATSALNLVYSTKKP